MLLFDYLQSLIPDLTPECTKVQLARFNGTDNPLDVYVAGKFEDWQSRQTRKNFFRKYVVSLIQSGNSQRWLYAGTFTVICCSGLPVPSSEWDGDFYTYDLERVVAADKYEGRMYVQSQYKERRGYPRGETLALDLCVEEISPVRLSFADFPGYRELVLNRDGVRLENGNYPTLSALSVIGSFDESHLQILRSYAVYDFGIGTTCCMP